MTVIMQSSSAAVATTLTALHAGALSMPQAAALVIGQHIGTTTTAVLAAIGASVAARRTALVHVLFNVITGAVVFAFLPPFVRLAEIASRFVEPASPAVGIAAFHTGFSLLGIVLLMPVMSRFCNLVERLVPERGPDLTRRLDTSVATLTPVAIEAVRLTLLDIMRTLAGALHDTLRDGPSPRSRGAVIAAANALEVTSVFLARIRTGPESSSEHERHVAVLSAFDHLTRLRAAVDQSAIAAAARELAAVEAPRRHLLGLLGELRNWPEDTNADAALPRLAEVSRHLAAARRDMRELVLRDTADGKLDPDAATRRLEAIAWMDRVGYHLWHGVARLCLRRADDHVPDSIQAPAHISAEIAPA
ncbi:MAG TPA: Na/Pi symporter, partial [Longimicrobiales bacterium]|nr:Na/Pi symporter [Longimicrobiales bacterium]